jgi:hypothetical protein
MHEPVSESVAAALEERAEVLRRIVAAWVDLPAVKTSECVKWVRILDVGNATNIHRDLRVRAGVLEKGLDLVNW